MVSTTSIFLMGLAGLFSILLPFIEYCIPFEPAMQTFEPRSALN